MNQDIDPEFIRLYNDNNITKIIPDMTSFEEWLKIITDYASYNKDFNDILDALVMDKNFSKHFDNGTNDNYKKLYQNLTDIVQKDLEKRTKNLDNEVEAGNISIQEIEKRIEELKNVTLGYGRRKVRKVRSKKMRRRTSRRS
jgi:hypothetical protein